MKSIRRVGSRGRQGFLWLSSELW